MTIQRQDSRHLRGPALAPTSIGILSVKVSSVHALQADRVDRPGTGITTMQLWLSRSETPVSESRCKPCLRLSSPVHTGPHTIQTGPHPHGTRHGSVSTGTASMSKILVGPGVHEGIRSTCKTTGSPLADPVRHHERYQVK